VKDKINNFMTKGKNTCEILHNLYSSLNITTIIKSRKVRWVVHVACMVTGEMCAKFWSGYLKGTSRVEHLGVNARTVSKRTSRETWRKGGAFVTWW